MPIVPYKFFPLFSLLFFPFLLIFLRSLCSISFPFSLFLTRISFTLFPASFPLPPILTQQILYYIVSSTILCSKLNILDSILRKICTGYEGITFCLSGRLSIRVEWFGKIKCYKFFYVVHYWCRTPIPKCPVIMLYFHLSQGLRKFWFSP